MNVINWIKKMQDYNVGEIMLSSVDKDGTNSGLDNELINKVKNIYHVQLFLVVDLI